MNLTVTLAEKPALILTYLVEHGPSTVYQLIGALAEKAQEGGGLYGGGLTLLHHLGFVEGPTHEHDRTWKATAEGVRVVERARLEGSA